MDATPELYRAPIDGRRCLRIAGRLKRLKLPLPAEPPQDVPPAACFLCHPERDRFDRGAWPERPDREAALRVVGNAFSIADAALLLAPPDERLHRATPAELEPALLAELLRAPSDESFLARFGLAGLELSAFFNVGVRGAQSRLHPHLQVVGFRRDALARIAASDADAADRAALAADLAAAEAEERALPLGEGVGVIPRSPGMTAELWVELPAPGAPPDAWSRAAAAVGAACRACAHGVSGSYNVVLRDAAPRLARVIPRGLSEPAGLELGSPARLDVVIATSAREAVLVWRAALGL